MAGDLTTDFVENGQIVENSLIKVLRYDQYEFGGKQSIHVLELSVVSAHPGHQLGNPLEILSTTTENPKEDVAHDDLTNNGLQKLYSCYYPTNQQALDSKIPRTGWNMEESGIDPPPRCTWIPATSRRFGDLSRCPSQESNQ